MLLASITIEALNTWANFVRAYYLSLVLGCRLERGARATLGINFPDFNAAIGHAVLWWNPKAVAGAGGLWDRRDEPPWHDPNTLLRLCQGLHASNLTDVQAAFSLGTRVFYDLPAFRNYFAHRNQDTQRSAQNLAPLHGIPATRRPAEILLTRGVGRPYPLLFDWLHEIEVVVELLCW